MRVDLCISGTRTYRLNAEVGDTKPKNPLKMLLAMDLCDFDLSVRAHGCLSALGIKTVGQLVATTERKLLACDNLGPTTIDEIKGMLSKVGLCIGASGRLLEECNNA
jgi:DNA-directed RNA polymerase alpha subunit